VAKTLEVEPCFVTPSWTEITADKWSDRWDIGVRASCSVEAYLKGELELPGVRLTRKLERPKIIAYEVDPPGLKDLGTRKLDGYACNENVGKQAIKEGIPIRALDERAFEEYLTGFQASRRCGGDER
jgi:hypothetical protein